MNTENTALYTALEEAYELGKKHQSDEDYPDIGLSLPPNVPKELNHLVQKHKLAIRYQLIK